MSWRPEGVSRVLSLTKALVKSHALGSAARLLMRLPVRLPVGLPVGPLLGTFIERIDQVLVGCKARRAHRPCLLHRRPCFGVGHLKSKRELLVSHDPGQDHPNCVREAAPAPSRDLFSGDRVPAAARCGPKFSHALTIGS